MGVCNGAWVIVFEGARVGICRDVQVRVCEEQYALRVPRERDGREGGLSGKAFSNICKACSSNIVKITFFQFMENLPFPIHGKQSCFHK